MVDVEHLTKYYGDKKVLDDISFSIADHQVVGLLGLNGAGKSTIMNILTGYLAATSGTVRIAGYDILSDATNAKKHIGYLPELFSFYPEMRVNDFLSFICDLKGVMRDHKERETHLSDICERVGLADERRRMIRNLSKGYRQRVGFAQALIGNPALLILDEPTASLDPSQVVDMRELIRETGKKSAVIVSSHILHEIQLMCDRVILIHEGKIAADDTPEGLSRKMMSTHRMVARIKGAKDDVLNALQSVPSVQHVEAVVENEPGAFDYRIEGVAGTDIREDVFHALAYADLPLLQTTRREQALEDVFLHVTGTDQDAQPIQESEELR